MCISLVDFIVICFAFTAIVLIVKYLSYRSWKKYFYKDESGQFKDHFTWKRFFKDLISLNLFKD